jgi:hypothetical protein
MVIIKLMTNNRLQWSSPFSLIQIIQFVNNLTIIVKHLKKCQCVESHIFKKNTHVQWYLYCLKATRRAPHMEHELFTLPEHMNSLKACSVQCFALIVCPCNCFLLPIVLTVVLLLTTSNYTYGIFTFFFCFFFLSIVATQ